MAINFPNTASISLRSAQDSPLTYSQMDNNWISLQVTDGNVINTLKSASFVAEANTFTEANTFSKSIKAQGGIEGDLSNNIAFTGSILPSTTGTNVISDFTLGSPTNVWKDLYVSTESIYFVNSSGVVVSRLSAGIDGISGSFIGELEGTASWALNAITASYVETAQTASYVFNAASADIATQALTAVSADVAETASYVDIKGSGITVNYNGTEIQLTGSTGGGVTQLIAGTNITLSPAGGTGVVTVTATGAAGIPTLQEVTTVGNQTSASVFITGSLTNGLDVIASGLNSHAEGRTTKAIGPYSHAEGEVTTAVGDYSHAEGSETTSIGDGSHTEGQRTTTVGLYSHAEGTDTIAIGLSSHAEGRASTAIGDYSYAGGFGVISSLVNQYVVGKYNEEITTVTKDSAFIVGMGTFASRKNGLEIYREADFFASYNGTVIRIPQIPTINETGSLPTGALYKDSNDFIKIMP